MKIPLEYGEWHCSVNNLNSITYRRFQHASLHDPIKNIEFRLEKKKLDKKNEKDIFFRSFDKYQLPMLQTRPRRKEDFNKQNQSQQTIIEQKKIKLKSLQKDSLTAKSKRTQLSRYGIGSSNNFSIPKFKSNFTRQAAKGQGQIYFSYSFNIAKQIRKVIQDEEIGYDKINMLISDVELLTGNIDRNQSILTTIKNIEFFKKNTMYFKFHYSQVRILFHVLLAELQLYENNLQSCIKQFQFCEYYCRKENLYSLIMCFLWEISRININLLKYEEADLNLRDLIEMALVCKNNNVIKYLLEHISVLYYYRGNSIMGHYYLKKSEQGLSSFQAEIILKQYSREDELKRLEKKLFNEPHQSVRQKRKNNKKFELDIWRSEKQKFHVIKSEYMEVVNKMMKDHEHAKIGRQIKKIAYNMHNQGLFFKQGDHENKRSMQENVRVSLDQNKKEGQNLNDSRRGSDIMRRSFEQSMNRRAKYVEITKEGVEENVTNVIKSHLSQNRENKKGNKEQRWKKFLSFLSSIESQVKEAIKSINLEFPDSRHLPINTNNNTRGKQMSRFNTLKTILESQRRIIL